MWPGRERKPDKSSLADRRKTREATKLLLKVETLPKRKKRDPERQWNYWKQEGFCGFYKCSTCGEMAICVGRYRDTVECEPCFKGLPKDVAQGA